MENRGNEMKQIIALAIVTLTAGGTLANAAGELIPVRKELPAEQNAYNLWTNAAAQMKLPDDKAIEEAFSTASNLHTNMPTAESRQKLEAWIDSKKEPLAMVSKGIALGEVQFSDLQSPISDLRTIARAKIILARGCVERAEYKEAARECREVFKMGQLICGGDGVLIQYLLGLNIQVIGLKGIQWLCGRDEMPPDILRQTLKDLPVPTVQDYNLAQAYRTDHARFFLSNIRSIEKKASESSNDFWKFPSYFQVNETIRMNSNFVARLAGNAISSWAKRDARIEADIQHLAPVTNMIDERVVEEFASNISMKKKETIDQLKELCKTQTNVMGRVLIMMNMSPQSQACERSVRNGTDVNLTRAFIALRILERETGELPESLEAIRSHQLTSDLPEDLFSGKPVLYSREKRILWSVGPDGKDDGGDEQKDFVVKLPEKHSDK
jgi:hypothetical protein